MSDITHYARQVLLLASIALVLPCSILQAQSRDDDDSQRRIQFRAMGMDGFIRGIGFVQGREVTEFNASHTHPTRWMEYRGNGPLNFYRASDLENIENIQNPEEVPPPIAQFNPPSSGEWLLLLVRNTGSAASGRYRVVPIPEDNDAVTEGIRLYNLTRESLAISINDTQFLLNAGNRRQVNPDPDHNDAMVMRIGAQGPSGWKMVSSSMFGPRPNARITYYIIRINDNIRFKRFVDPVPNAGEGSS